LEKKREVHWQPEAEGEGRRGRKKLTGEEGSYSAVPLLTLLDCAERVEKSIVPFID
jgi:hypothetical protein